MACDNREIVQKALGHTSEKTTSIYTTMAVARVWPQQSGKHFQAEPRGSGCK